MVKISVEVREGAAHFVVAIRAESIRRALCLLEEGYPGADLRVACQTAPEEFSADGSAARAGAVTTGPVPEGLAA